MVLAAGLMIVVVPGAARGQIGSLVSPGRLSRAHASLEGITRCLSCHAPGQGVSAAKCLSCHKPVADRIAQKTGVHRRVTDDCVTCHVEHAGVDGNLRPFDERRFDHAIEAGVALDGLHAPLAGDCAACHKTRSFLALNPACGSCHTDTHKGSLGSRCATCHTTAVRFVETSQRFDHNRTKFPLTDRHVGVKCASCHKTGTYRDAASASCASCHVDPHEKRQGPNCSSCHTAKAWRTTRVDHAKTSFRLTGLHASVACAACHVRPATAEKLAFGRCATCHADPHKGAFRQDCAACHTETGFQKGTFDHATTSFSLADGHAGLVCVKCHTNAPTSAGAGGRIGGRGAGGTSGPGRGVRPAPPRGAAAAANRTVDFSGLKTECVSCHNDVHEAELGAACETCHSVKTFAVLAFSHARHRPFFEGRHAALRCGQCHLPARSGPVPVGRTPPAPPAISRTTAETAVRLPLSGLSRTSDACSSCHADVHVGQVGTRCDACHAVDVAKFGLTGFSHEATRFPLTGRHAPVACEACHDVEARPSAAGTARRLAGIGTECATCHADPHDGQLSQGCDRCHTVEAFTVSGYSHLRARALSTFFKGRHVSASCGGCHRPAATRAGRAVAASYGTSTTCTGCHADKHRGALGSRCESCHRP